MLGATGSALVYKEAYWRLVYPELRETTEPAAVTAADHAAAIAAADAGFGDALRSVKLPEPGVAGYHLYLAEGEAFLAPGDHHVIDRWRPTDRPMALLFDLHAHLMAGDAGERVGGVIGLLGALMVISGVYLWWPARRRFRLRTLIPTGFARRKILPSHRDLGLITSPLLLVLLLTGSGMVFYEATGTMLNGILSGRAPIAEEPPAVPDESGIDGADEGADDGAVEGADAVGRSSAGTAALLDRAAATFPGARIVFYYPPDDAGLHGFRMKQPCEVHPNGRSYVYMTGHGEVVHAVDACRQPAGERALHAVYPLHAGKMDSGTYKLLTFLGGLALTLISATGVAAYLAKLTGAR